MKTIKSILAILLIGFFAGSMQQSTPKQNSSQRSDC